MDSSDAPESIMDVDPSNANQLYLLEGLQMCRSPSKVSPKNNTGLDVAETSNNDQEHQEVQLHSVRHHQQQPLHSKGHAGLEASATKENHQPQQVKCDNIDHQRQQPIAPTGSTALKTTLSNQGSKRSERSDSQAHRVNHHQQQPLHSKGHAGLEAAETQENHQPQQVKCDNIDHQRQQPIAPTGSTALKTTLSNQGSERSQRSQAHSPGVHHRQKQPLPPKDHVGRGAFATPEARYLRTQPRIADDHQQESLPSNEGSISLEAFMNPKKKQSPQPAGLPVFFHYKQPVLPRKACYDGVMAAFQTRQEEQRPQRAKIHSVDHHPEQLVSPKGNTAGLKSAETSEDSQRPQQVGLHGVNRHALKPDLEANATEARARAIEMLRNYENTQKQHEGRVIPSTPSYSLSTTPGSNLRRPSSFTPSRSLRRYPSLEGELAAQSAAAAHVRKASIEHNKGPQYGVTFAPALESAYADYTSYPPNLSPRRPFRDGKQAKQSAAPSHVSKPSISQNKKPQNGVAFAPALESASADYPSYPPNLSPRRPFRDGKQAKQSAAPSHMRKPSISQNKKPQNGVAFAAAPRPAHAERTSFPSHSRHSRDGEQAKQSVAPARVRKPSIEQHKKPQNRASFSSTPGPAAHTEYTTSRQSKAHSRSKEMTSCKEDAHSRRRSSNAVQAYPGPDAQHPQSQPNHHESKHTDGADHQDDQAWEDAREWEDEESEHDFRLNYVMPPKGDNVFYNGMETSQDLRDMAISMARLLRKGTAKGGKMAFNALATSPRSRFYRRVVVNHARLAACRAAEEARAGLLKCQAKYQAPKAKYCRMAQAKYNAVMDKSVSANYADATKWATEQAEQIPEMLNGAVGKLNDLMSTLGELRPEPPINTGEYTGNDMEAMEIDESNDEFSEDEDE